MQTDSSPPFALPSREWLRARINEQPNGCWIARGHRSKGYVRWNKHYSNGWWRTLLAHQWAYLIFVGPIPPGTHLDHRCHPIDGSCPGGGACEHRSCCNPAHLQPVPLQANVLRSLSFAAVNARKTHCPLGHPYDEANTHVTPRGYRRCRACDRIAGAARRMRSREV